MQSDKLLSLISHYSIYFDNIELMNTEEKYVCCLHINNFKKERKQSEIKIKIMI